MAICSKHSPSMTDWHIDICKCKRVNTCAKHIDSGGISSLLWVCDRVLFTAMIWKPRSPSHLFTFNVTPISSLGSSVAVKKMCLELQNKAKQRHMLVASSRIKKTNKQTHKKRCLSFPYAWHLSLLCFLLNI